MSHTHKIKTTGGMFLLQFLLAAIIFFLVLFLPTILTIGGTTPLLLCFAAVFVSHFFMFKVRALTGSTRMNEVHVLMDAIFKTKRAVSDGIYGKNVHDVVAYKLNLEAMTTCEIVETVQCADGSVVIMGIATTRPDWTGTETERTEKMLNLVSFKEVARKKMIGVKAKESARERLKNKKVSDAILMSGSAVLTVADFRNVQKSIGSKFELVSIFDIDLSEDSKESALAIGRGRALATVARILIDEGGFSPEKAHETATLLDKNIDNAKHIYEVQGIPSNLFAAIDAAAKTLKKVKDAMGSSKKPSKPSPSPTKKTK